MIYGRSKILDWFDMQGNKPYFSIMRKTESQSGNFVFSNKDKEGETIETGRAYLDRCLQTLGSGDYFIYCNEKSQVSSKGRSETFFSISLNEAQAAAPAQPVGVGGISIEEVNRLADTKFQQLMNDKELKEAKEKVAALTRENRELMNRTQQPWNKFIEGISPYIGNIAEQMGFTKGLTRPVVSGIKEDEKLVDNAQAQPTQEEVVKINQEFLEALSELFPDTWTEIMVMLTDTIKNDPEKIKLAIKLL